MLKPFRLALVGAGMITQESHLPAALGLPRVKVVAIVEPVRARAGALANAYGIAPTIVAQLQDVLREVDGVVIATPNDTHKDLAVQCIEAGVGTLIEKPLASTFDDGKAIVQASVERGTVLAVGYVTRFRENVLFLSELLKAGYFGRIRRFAHQFGTSGGWSSMSSYHLNRQATGGGVLMITGTHFLDRMLHFWGYPDAMEFADDACGGPEANCVATLRYMATGAPFVGTVLYSKSVRLPGGLVIETDQGIVKVADTDGADIVFYPHDHPGVAQVIRRRGTPPYPPQMNVFQRQLEDFIAACQDGRRPLVDGHQGLTSLHLVDSLYAQRKTMKRNWYGHVPAQVGS